MQQEVACSGGQWISRREDPNPRKNVPFSLQSDISGRAAALDCHSEGGLWKGKSKEKGGEGQHKCSEQRAADRARATGAVPRGPFVPVLSLGRGVL